MGKGGRHGQGIAIRYQDVAVNRSGIRQRCLSALRHVDVVRAVDLSHGVNRRVRVAARDGLKLRPAEIADGPMARIKRIACLPTGIADEARIVDGLIARPAIDSDGKVALR